MIVNKDVDESLAALKTVLAAERLKATRTSVGVTALVATLLS